jgi:drug/metabolite transporter (DMT)-like permease
VSSRRTGLVLAVASVLAFTPIGTVAKEAYRAGGSLTGIVAIRFGIAALVWAIYLWPRRGLLAAHRGAVVVLAAAGVAGALGSSYAEFAAYLYLPVGLTLVILFSDPMWVALVERVFLARRIGVRGVAAIAAVVVGLALLLGVGSHFSGLGIAFAFLASVAVTALLLGLQRAAPELTSLAAAGVLTVTAGIVAVPVGLVTGGLQEIFAAPGALGYAALLGLTASVAGIAFLSGAVGRLGAMDSAIITATEPVLSAAMAWAILGESLRPVQIVGGLLVLGGAVVVASTRRPPSTAAAAAGNP